MSAENFTQHAKHYSVLLQRIMCLQECTDNEDHIRLHVYAVWSRALMSAYRLTGECRMCRQWAKAFWSDRNDVEVGLNWLVKDSFYLIWFIIVPDNRGSRKILFLSLQENLCCEFSLEVPQWGTSHEYHNICFCVEIRKASTIINWKTCLELWFILLQWLKFARLNCSQQQAMITRQQPVTG